MVCEQFIIIPQTHVIFERKKCHAVTFVFLSNITRIGKPYIHGFGKQPPKLIPQYYLRICQLLTLFISFYYTEQGGFVLHNFIKTSLCWKQNISFILQMHHRCRKKKQEVISLRRTHLLRTSGFLFLSIFVND